MNKLFGNLCVSVSVFAVALVLVTLPAFEAVGYTYEMAYGLVAKKEGFYVFGWQHAVALLLWCALFTNELAGMVRHKLRVISFGLLPGILFATMIISPGICGLPHRYPGIYLIEERINIIPVELLCLSLAMIFCHAVMGAVAILLAERRHGKSG